MRASNNNVAKTSTKFNIKNKYNKKEEKKDAINDLLNEKESLTITNDIMEVVHEPEIMMNAKNKLHQNI